MENRRKPGFFMILFCSFFFRWKNYWKFTLFYHKIRSFASQIARKCRIFNIFLFLISSKIYLGEIFSEVHMNTNLEFSQWVNVLYDQRMTTALIGRLTHHVELILFPGVNNRLRESSINETLSKINSQKE
jgi:hypothetical protein